MKTKLPYLLFTITFTTLLNAQVWNVVGTLQYTNDAEYVTSTIDESTGFLYTAYVDATNQNHLIVRVFNGTTWSNLGPDGQVSSTGNVSYPDIKIHPITGEVWTVYRTDVSGVPSLMAKRFNGTTWITEGMGINYNNETPYEKIILQFDPINGHAYVAAIYEATGVNRRAAIVTNRSGGWADEELLANNIISYGLDYPQHDKAIYATVPNGSGVQTTTVRLKSYTGNSWNIPNSSTVGDVNTNGLGAIMINSTLFEAITYQFTSTAFLPTFNSNNPVGLSFGQPVDGTSIQFVKNNTTNRTVLLYTETDGDVFIWEYDPSLANSSDPMAAWINIYNGILNVGGDTTQVKLSINQSTGQIYVTYKDGNSISTREFFPNLQLDRIYVDANASGNNDGSSWADAFSDLQTGIIAASNTIEKAVWVAQGTYNPGTNRNDAFEIDLNAVGDDIKLYGGFNGTETNLTDRDWLSNLTILTGDVNGDDDSNLTYSNTTRGENNYNVVRIIGSDNVVVDGFTITGGHANNISTGAPPNQNRGGAIYKDGVALGFTLENCVIKNNVSNREGNVNIQTFNGQTQTVTIQNNIVNNNLARYSSGIQIAGNQQSTITANVYGNLFYENRAEDIEGNASLSGSSISAISNSANITANVINNTFVNNYDTGTLNASVDKGTLALRRFQFSGQPVPVLNTNIHNNIFYENFVTSGNVLNINDIGLMNQPSNLINSINYTHNLTANESSLASKTNNLTTSNNIDANPLFVDQLAKDFRLNAGSPVVNAGDSNIVPSTLLTDLDGNSRMINAVDIGAYEFDSTLSNSEFNFEESQLMKIFPNPVESMLYIQADVQIKDVSVFNHLGQLVVKRYNQKQIDLSKLKPNLYFIEISTLNGNRMMKKIIVK